LAIGPNVNLIKKIIHDKTYNEKNFNLLVEENRVLKQENETLKEENAKIRQETDAKMAEMQTKFESQMTSLLAAVGQKRGRKPKVEE
jgi:regulator of replication initiation timing